MRDCKRIVCSSSVHEPARLARRSRPACLLDWHWPSNLNAASRRGASHALVLTTNHANPKTKNQQNGRRFRQSVPCPRHSEPPRLRTCRLPDPDQGRAPLGGRRGDPQLRRMRVSQSLLCRSNQIKCTGYTLGSCSERASEECSARTAPK